MRHTKINRINSINVVPFIDIMLVLLVIVLMTATFAKHGLISVDLSNGYGNTKIKLDKEVVVTIKKDGEIFLNKTRCTLNNLVQKVAIYDKTVPIYLNADKGGMVEGFVAVIDTLTNSGYTNIGIITKK